MNRIHPLTKLDDVARNKFASIMFKDYFEISPSCDIDLPKINHLFVVNICHKFEADIYNNHYVLVKHDIEIKDTTESNTSASYFDLFLSIGRDGRLSPEIYKKSLPLRCTCIRHFKPDVIDNMDNIRISGTEPSSVILSQTK